MTAPAEEIVEQSTENETFTHYFCPACLPPVGVPLNALCGTYRPAGWSGNKGFDEDDCMVCRTLWFTGFTCRRCGYVKLPRGIG